MRLNQAAMACSVCSALTSSGEDVEPEVAAAFGPFVVLLGQDGADEADDRVPVGEDRFLVDTSLPPGEYVVRLVGSTPHLEAW